ncbi:MAG: nucleotidyl transferase AbiEii/AbiGii toxin family protein [Alphaproteobacteria bacterium]|nr:nucleotidyl transferase AbiEii/AbiGii toxin family protein [Alphaproteobacteria bacterium]
MKGLSDKTLRIFEAVSKTECIKPYVLVGGTALNLQIGARESEDLDFMRWKKRPDERLEVDWPSIKKEFSTFAEVQNIDILDIDHIEFLVDGVKISFYAADKYAPEIQPITFCHNLKVADINAIGAMKMEVMLRRCNFRDYYDLYAILQTGVDIKTLIDNALRYSRHCLKTKNLISMLTNGNRFHVEHNFPQLNPVYDVTAAEIEDFMKGVLEGKV